METKRKELLEKFTADLKAAQAKAVELTQALNQVNTQVVMLQGAIQALEMMAPAVIAEERT